MAAEAASLVATPEPLGSAMVYARDVRCPSCAGTWKDPVPLTCGHTMCSACTAPLLYQLDGSNVLDCPACNRTCDMFEAPATSTRVAALLEKLQRPCRNPDCRARSTPWDAHVCPWVACAFCHKGVPDVPQHLANECTQLPCVGHHGCGWRGEAAVRDAHQDTCSAARLVRHLRATGVLAA